LRTAWKAILVAAILAAPRAQAAPTFLNCSIQFGSINFGSFSTLSTQPIDSSTVISGHCTGPTTLHLTLGTGNGAAFDRHLAHGQHKLRYNLYLDAPRSQVWGDGTRGTQAQLVRVQGNFSFPVFARIFPNQEIPAGAYHDDLVITVDF
jgi:spore coat protein U-like protein